MDQTVSFPVWTFISAAYTHVSFAAAPQRIKGLSFLVPSHPCKCPCPNLIFSAPCGVAFCRKATDTLRTRSANHLHLFKAFLCNKSGSSLVCSCLNSYSTFHFFTTFLFCCKPVAFCS